MNLTAATSTKKSSSQIFSATRGFYRKLQPREKLIVWFALAVIVLICSSELYVFVDDAFETQAKRLEESINDMDLVSAALSRFSTLKTRERAIEDAYKQVEMEGPALSYLEKILKEKAGTVSGLTISAKPSRKFGDGFEQTPYTMKFNTVDTKRLVEFLKELVEGPRPVLLSEIKIKPRPARDGLEVELVISSIKRLKPQGS